MENSIDTADAMKARGYGLHGRTNFPCSGSASGMASFLGFWVGFLCSSCADMLWVGMDFYYPYVDQIQMAPKDIVQFGAVLIFMLIPG